MPRRKEQNGNPAVEYGNPPVPTPPANEELPPSFAAQYKAVVERPNHRGRISAYEPLYCPPGVKLTLIVNPVSEGDRAAYLEMKMRGWMPLAANLCTDDEWKAKAEGLVAFPSFSEMNGSVVVGPYLVMWRPMKDFMEDYVRDVRRLTSATQGDGVQVLEDTSKSAEASVVTRE